MTRPPFISTSPMSRRTLVTITAVLIVILGLGSGAAYAYFRASGSSTSAPASVGTEQAVTISTNATSGALLHPGGTGDLVITATNPNPGPVHITALALGTIAGCATPAISLTTPSTTYLPVTIPAHASGLRIDIVGALSMDASASSDCQGVTFSIPLSSVTVHQ